MKRFKLVLAAAAGVALVAAMATAQDTQGGTQNTPTATATSAKSVNSPTLTAEQKIAAAPTIPQIDLQNYRPEDQRGLNVFEAPKTDSIPYQGFKLFWGAAFTQQFQGLDHSNTASPKLVTTAGVTTDQNKLIRIAHGPNNAVANLYLTAPLAPGIRVAMTTYSSARHHNETWVKDGYLLVDASPIDWAPLNNLMKFTTIRAGHFEVNYGDAHWRRTDNGNAMRNPLVGNYIMDAFTTEVGAEVMVRKSAALAMVAITGGESRGMIAQPEKRSPSYLAKLGFDKQLSPLVRVRLTGSMYATSGSVSNTLYSGDRAGSRYYDVLENTASSESAQAWSGSIQTGFKNMVHAFVINPFVKVHGLEFFGNLERARGRASTEATNREFKQYVAEATYRFLPMNQLFVAARYNRVTGQFVGFPNDISVNRSQVGGGWFITPNVVLKTEFVTQRYNDFPVTDIRHGGKFRGFMVESTVAF